jgi:hypothetical protein
MCRLAPTLAIVRNKCTRNLWCDFISTTKGLWETAGVTQWHRPELKLHSGSKLTCTDPNCGEYRDVLYLCRGQSC